MVSYKPASYKDCNNLFPPRSLANTVSYLTWEFLFRLLIFTNSIVGPPWLHAYLIWALFLISLRSWVYSLDIDGCVNSTFPLSLDGGSWLELWVAVVYSLSENFFNMFNQFCRNGAHFTHFVVHLACCLGCGICQPLILFSNSKILPRFASGNEN